MNQVIGISYTMENKYITKNNKNKYKQIYIVKLHGHRLKIRTTLFE